jgi:hypothetical protein
VVRIWGFLAARGPERREIYDELATTGPIHRVVPACGFNAPGLTIRLPTQTDGPAARNAAATAVSSTSGTPPSNRSSWHHDVATLADRQQAVR